MFKKYDAEHPLDTLSKKYSLTIDWTGTSYIYLVIDWQYDNVFFDISMPEYVPKELSKFHHISTKRTRHAPHPWTFHIYSQRIQYTTKDLSTPLDKKESQRVQAIAGTFLYYGLAVNPAILSSLNSIANKQASPKTLTKTSSNQLLDYLHAHPHEVLRYQASDMILCLVSNVAYLVLPNVRSRCATLFTLTNNPTTLTPKPSLNGPLHVMVKTIKGVPASAYEAKTGGIFLGAHEACPIVTTLF